MKTIKFNESINENNFYYEFHPHSSTRYNNLFSVVVGCIGDDFV